MRPEEDFHRAGGCATRQLAALLLTLRSTLLFPSARVN
jgi:hypothetical protein